MPYGVWGTIWDNFGFEEVEGNVCAVALSEIIFSKINFLTFYYYLPANFQQIPPNLWQILGVKSRETSYCRSCSRQQQSPLIFNQLHVFHFYSSFYYIQMNKEILWLQLQNLFAHFNIYKVDTLSWNSDYYDFAIHEICKLPSKFLLLLQIRWHILLLCACVGIMPCLP